MVVSQSPNKFLSNFVPNVPPQSGLVFPSSPASQDEKSLNGDTIKPKTSAVFSTDLSMDVDSIEGKKWTFFLFNQTENLFPPGLEPGTFRVLGERDNHYTTESW